MILFMTYPVERIPSEILSTQTVKPKLPVRPEKPYEPILYYYVEKPNNSALTFPLSVIGFFIVSIFLAFYKNSEIAFVLIWYALFSFTFGYKLFIKPIVNYFDNLNKYNDHVINVDANYSKESVKYNQVLMPEYPKKLTDWKHTVAKLSSPKYISNMRKQEMTNIFLRSGVPLSHPNAHNLKKGVTENDVLKVLNQYFPGKIYISGTTCNTKKEVGLWSPLPDFVLHDKEIGYNIVIEIDEPYDLEYGNPIHCDARNSIRDEYFLQNNWPVLRFAESQFVIQPMECCDYIANFVNGLTLGMSNMPTSDISKSLNKVECWTEEEATSMESSGFRELYLPDGLLGGGLMEMIYRDNGPEIRRSRREKLVADELEREKEREKERLREREWRRNYIDPDDDNDLPF